MRFHRLSTMKFQKPSGNTSTILAFPMIVIGSVVALVGCGGSGAGSSTGSSNSGGYADVDVYVGGACEDSSGIYVGGYWKNGSWLSLERQDPTKESFVNALIVSNGNVYAAGYIVNSSGKIVPGYWKDQTWVALLPPSGYDGDAWVVDLALSGEDVYALGQCNSADYNAGGYWRNGAWTKLSSCDTKNDTVGVYSIAVDGSHVYAGGQLGTLSYSPWLSRPVYWTDGTCHIMDGTGNVSGVSVSGGDVYAAGVYAAGSNDIFPGYWKNGTWVQWPKQYTNLNQDIDYVEVSCLVVSNGDIYIGGVANNDSLGIYVGGYWKNGVGTGVTAPGKSYHSSVDSLAVLNGNVYASGGYKDDDDSIWKRGYWCER